MYNRPPSLPLPTTILQGTDLVVLGKEFNELGLPKIQDQRKDRPRG